MTQPRSRSVYRKINPITRDQISFVKMFVCLSSLSWRKHSSTVPLEWKPLCVEQSDFDSAQHNCGETLDWSGVFSRVLFYFNCPKQYLSVRLCLNHETSVFFLFSCSWQSGDIDIVNNTTKDTCRLKFSPYSYFSREVPRKVSLMSFHSALADPQISICQCLALRACL